MSSGSYGYRRIRRPSGDHKVKRLKCNFRTEGVLGCIAHYRQGDFMGPSVRKAVKASLAGGLAALALSTSAYATLVTYGGTNNNASSLTVASSAIDLGSVVTSFTARATL